MPALIIKRRFAVMLEDAIRVARPSDETLAEFDGDLEAWARVNMETIYEEAYERQNKRGVGGPEFLWADQHHADLDFPEVEYEIEEEA